MTTLTTEERSAWLDFANGCSPKQIQIARRLLREAEIDAPTGKTSWQQDAASSELVESFSDYPEDQRAKLANALVQALLRLGDDVLAEESDGAAAIDLLPCPADPGIEVDANGNPFINRRRIVLNAGWYVNKKGKRKFFARYRFTIGGLTAQHSPMYFIQSRKLAENERTGRDKRGCEQCGKKFEPKRFGGKVRFCSDRCRKQAQRARMSPNECTDNHVTAGGIKNPVSEANVT
jgi:hypothetical protein